MTEPKRRIRGAERDELVRNQLEPLAPGERPTALTVAAVVAALFAVANIVATAIGADFSGGQDQGFWAAVPFPFLLLVAAVGMWLCKYWAVLGFQAMLAIQMIVLSLATVRATSFVAVAVVLVLLTLMGVLFWKLVRAMARVQISPPASRTNSDNEEI